MDTFGQGSVLFGQCKEMSDLLVESLGPLASEGSWAVASSKTLTMEAQKSRQ